MTPSYKAASDEEEQAYKWARQRAEAIQGLYIHLLVFVVINACLFGINWLATGGDGGWWAVWPLLGWGVGVLIHVLVVVAPVFSPDWVDRRADKLMARHR